ncbi:MAG: carboxypeptidase regulatory-like domain-containing protein [Acidobacteriaceae bacterium]|nr:carboxypeptidase regulatory-like domain-containing protein [Acidobacteriaceae bacterium]
MKIHLQQKVAVIFAAFVLVTVGAILLNTTVSAAGDGSITGSVKISGTPPHMRGIDMSKDPYCVKQHQTPVQMENVVVGSSGGLQNVVLYISEGLTGNESSAVSSEEPTFDQKGCQYIPHVIAVNPGEKYKVTTSDQTTHNIHPLPAPGSGNIGWNKSQPPGAPPIETDWKAPELAVSVKCNIHPWMHGWHAVVKGPHAVSDESGNYTIKNVPAGSYTVTAWQEDLGTQTAKVNVAAGQSAKADFTFKAK